jgi:glycosyltransferase involved in cell wall biosynthesis
MRVLQVSTTDEGGGAEKIAWNLLQSYKALGHESWMAVGFKKSSDSSVFEIPNHARRSWWSRAWLSGDAYFKGLEKPSRTIWTLRRILASISDPVRGLNYWRGLEDFHFPGTSHLLELTPSVPDIVHCHNLHGNYFDLRVLPSLSAKVPTVLTLHDAWLTTGHCAHSFACERWTTGCGQCPDLTIYPAIRRDATAANWKMKHELLSTSRLWIAAPSRWLIERAERSLLQAAAVEMRIIPNGVDLDVFKPGDREAARADLNLPQDAHIVLFAAVPAKTAMWGDLPTIESALRELRSTADTNHIIGVALGRDASQPDCGGIKIRNILPIRDSAILAKYYQAADLYLHASRADTFPTMVIEAQACGLPVVASSVGGIPEQIVDRATGILIPSQDAAQMAAAIRQLLDNKDMRLGIGRRAAERARRLYGSRQQAAAYLDWYRNISEQFSRGGSHASFTSIK